MIVGGVPDRGAESISGTLRQWKTLPCHTPPVRWKPMSTSAAESIPPGSQSRIGDPSESLDARTHPVINTPYEEPRRHWELDAHGRAAEGRPPKAGRRPPHGILPVPKPKKVEPGQGVLELSPDDINETVEEVRVQLRNHAGRIGTR